MEQHRIIDFKNYKMPDSEVIKRVLAGEKELYEILLRRNNQTLYRIVRGYLTGEEEIKDTMQSTYLKAFEKLHQFNHEAEFSTWLIRIGINEALAFIKKEKRRGQFYDPLPEEMNSNLAEVADKHRLDPEGAMMRKEAKQILEQSINQLSPIYRVVYVMSEIEGLSMKEISGCLDISISNAKVRLHRARTMIKEDLYDRSYSDNLYEFGFNKCDEMVESVMQFLFKESAERL